MTILLLFAQFGFKSELFIFVSVHFLLLLIIGFSSSDSTWRDPFYTFSPPARYQSDRVASNVLNDKTHDENLLGRTVVQPLLARIITPAVDARELTAMSLYRIRIRWEQDVVPSGLVKNSRIFLFFFFSNRFRRRLPRRRTPETTTRARAMSSRFFFFFFVFPQETDVFCYYNNDARGAVVRLPMRATRKYRRTSAATARYPPYDISRINNRVRRFARVPLVCISLGAEKRRTARRGQMIRELKRSA